MSIFIMNCFSSLEDAINAIHGGFALGCRTFETHTDALGQQRQTTVWVLCGLPGVGKSTLADAIYRAYPPLRCRIISRDNIRTDLIWQARKEDPKKEFSDLDQKVTKTVLQQIKQVIKTRCCVGLVIDGCHTRFSDLLNLLQFLNGFLNQIQVNLLIVGNELSDCNHGISNKKEGDYSDYSTCGQHNAVPYCVLARKRKELAETLRVENLVQIFQYVDTCMSVAGYRANK